MIFYNLMTLDAAAMLDNAVVSRKEENSNNPQPEFTFDFRDRSIKHMVLSATDRHADNALFYQLIESIYGSENTAQYRRMEDCIKRTLVYVDFRALLSSQTINNNRRKKRSFSINGWKEADIDDQCLIFFEDGFSLIFEDGEKRTYLPFDKSGNMSRNYCITFIDKDIFDAADERVRMGLDFSSIKTVLSKYYAYRGLYLTDGTRIEEEEGFLLNHKTVVVIEDDSHDYMRGGEVLEVPVVTADIDLLRRGIFKSVETQHPIRLNGFDGEGLISPQYAEQINETLKKEIHMKWPAASFQLRMPFVKGMLHQVDFQRFFSDKMPPNDYYIKDIFGIPRKLSDVQIVLTESMFKCAKWLKEFMKQNPEISDPMEWYFDLFHNYHHALYIGNTDANMGSGKVTLNYQFLNTLDISPKELDILVKRHLQETHSILETGARYALDITEYISDMIFGDAEKLSTIPAWRYALDLNPDFVKDPLVRTMLKSDENARLKDVVRGRLLVDGSLKYLSGDLLAFLIHMIYHKKPEKESGGEVNGLGVMTDSGFQIMEDINRKIAKKLKLQVLRSNKFYTADHIRLGLESDERYCILRNPHLSRNEQCALKPYTPEETDRYNIYNRYFSHLKNVIMFAYESVDALSLGGADYDGDTVKLILDKTVNSAVLNGAYRFSFENKEFIRRYPIVDIPSMQANREEAPRMISYRMVKATFSNQVGLISNLAIRIGKKEYKGDEAAKEYANKCAECTLATGLEIDAVKTGVRPNLDELKKNADSGKDYYLMREEILDQWEKLERLKVSKKQKTGPHGGDVYVLERPLAQGEGNKQYKKMFDAEFIPTAAMASTIDRLPGYLLKDIAESKEKGEAADKKRQREILLFKFQIDEETGAWDSSWVKKLKAEPNAVQKLDQMSALIKAYRKIAGDANYIKTQKEKADRSDNMKKIWTLLMTIYDSREGLPDSHTDIPSAIEIARADIRNLFETTADVEAAIQRMKDLDWVMVCEDERETVLYQILGTEQLETETKEILLTEEEKGYEFLKFYLYEIRNEIRAMEPFETIQQTDEKKKKSLHGYSAEAYEDFLREYIDGQKDKEPKRIWNERVVYLCRDRLASSDLFDGDFDQALRYYYACREVDPGRHFLWEVFRTGEILRNVYIKPKEKNSAG